MRRALIPASLLVFGAVILGATLFPQQIAHAATPFTNVLVGNTASNPVPVTVQNTDTNGAVKVHEQGTDNVAQSGDWNVGVTNTADHPVPVSGAVNVGNLPDAPTTRVIDHGVTTAPGGDVAFSVVSDTDVSAYREITLYLQASTTGGGGQVCIASTVSADNSNMTLDSFQFGDAGGDGFATIKTYSPAPPNFRMECFNNLSQDVEDTWMLVGRTG